MNATLNEILRRALFLPEQASTYSLRADHLHYFVIITTFVSATLIGLTAVYWVFRWHRRPGTRTTPHFASPRWAEALIIGVPLSFFLLWFAMGFRDYVWLRDPPKGATDVYVMGKQWMWKFAYPGGPSSVESLVLPQGRPVRLLITSRDVIHSFFVPAFRVKQDALPGRYTEIWIEPRKTGRFDILCAEYCGSGHSFMRAAVTVLPPAEFDAWIARNRRGMTARQDMSLAAGPTLVDQGRLAAESHQCLKCHTTDGTRHIGPTWLDLYGRQERLSDGSTVVADEPYLTESMMDPMAKIVAGYSPVMPTYQGQLSAAESAAIVEYIKSLRSRPLPSGPSEGPVYEPVRSR